MVECVPSNQEAVNVDINDALTEKMTEVTQAANVISEERKSFAELKSFVNPPVLVYKLLGALHAFKLNIPAKNVNWADTKKGPIFKRQFSLDDLDLNNLTANQLQAMQVIKEFDEGKVRSTSQAASYVQNYFFQVNGYLELMDKVNNERE